jgi:hypothetical protein
MKKIKLARIKKRVLSATLTLALVAGMVSVADFGNGSVSKAAKSQISKSYSNTVAGTPSRIRGTVWNCSDMPKQTVNGVSYSIDGDNLTSGNYKKWLAAWQSAKKGTTERPFMILEVVPYYECASIGYSIEGCEPVAMERLCGNSRAYDYGEYSSYKDLFYFYRPSGKVYFFEDEQEGKRKFYCTSQADDINKKATERINSSAWTGLKRTTVVTDSYTGQEGVPGYFEMVKDKGSFKYEVVDGKRKITKIANTGADSSGNLNWHSLNEFCRDEVKNADANFNGFVVDINDETVNLDDYYVLNNIGDRYYAFRKNSETDPCYDVSEYYQAYVNTDIFCKSVLGLDEAGAENYSVLVKTISFTDLNANPKWCDFADLICMYGITRQTELIKMWRWKNADNATYNRNDIPYCGLDLANGTPDDLGSLTYPGTTNSTWYANRSRQLNWDVVGRIINRVAAARNYAGLVIDKASLLDPIIAKEKSVAFHRYNLDGTKAGEDTWNLGASNNNIYKLWVMCTTISPNVVKNEFINKEMIEVVNTTENSRDRANVCTLKLKGREGDEASYWSGASFYIGSNDWPDTWMQNLSAEQKKQYWEKYEGYLNVKEDPKFVNAHVYTYQGDTAMYSGFVNNSVGSTGDGNAITRFSSFNDYIDNNAKTKEIYCTMSGKTSGEYDSNVNSNNIASWAALRYILDLDDDVNYYFDKIRVLDIEPGVGLSNGTTNNTNNSRPNWKFTEKDVMEFFPRFTTIDISNTYGGISTNQYGTEITLDHMISSEFVGKNVDLNSSYDLIYLGDDADAFWTVGDIKNLQKTDENVPLSTTLTDDRTDFYDDALDGLVYFHIGDLLELKDTLYTPWKQKVNLTNVDQANYVGSYDIATKTMTEVYSGRLRQPGNDITALKKTALESYLKGGSPIVVADHLLEPGYVQSTDGCIMYAFLTGKKSDLIKRSEVGGISNAIEEDSLENKLKEKIRHPLRVLSGPDEYYYKGDVNTIKYLQRETVMDNTHAYMEFKLQIPTNTEKAYYYKIFYDTDRNAKFESYECQIEGYVDKLSDFANLKATAKSNVPNGWAGFIQWKIEVYEAANPDHRASMEGCSANKEVSAKKNKITALQICSNQATIKRDPETGAIISESASFQGTNVFLDSPEWRKLYDEVESQGIFEITVDVVTWDEFNQIFKDAYEASAEDDADKKKFSFNMGMPIGTKMKSNGEPEYDENGDLISNPDFKLRNIIENSKCGTRTLYDYNMIVIGFGDGYGLTDLDNNYGAAEYLYYYIESGNSILFTHDLTAYFTEPKARNEGRTGASDRVYGYTANILMRDLMGMNRYGVINKYITMDSDYFRSGLVDDLLNYRNGNQGKDATEKAKKTIHYDSTVQNEKQGFTLWGGLRKLGDGGSNYSSRSQYKYLVQDPDTLQYHDVKSGGTGSNNCETTLAVRLNKGQITQYPFTIDENLTVRATHSQYYELNMEEPELTVWYTLEDTKPYGKGRGGNFDSALMYGVTPHNASNYYYIYSKGNVFYSGVGHREINNDEERKLFVNTLIAAYRPKTDKPQVEITNEEADRSGSSYTIRLDQDFEYGSDGLVLGAEVAGNGPLYVTFVPKDSNNEEYIRVRANYDGETSNLKVYNVAMSGGAKVAGGEVAPMAVGGTVTEENTFWLKVDQEYVIIYDREEINTRNHIIFRSENSGNIGSPSITELNIKSRPMFRLD